MSEKKLDERPDLPVDTPVWVRYADRWHKRYFAEWRGDLVACWAKGGTSQTADGLPIIWKRWRLDDPEKDKR